MTKERKELVLIIKMLNTKLHSDRVDLYHVKMLAVELYFMYPYVEIVQYLLERKSIQDCMFLVNDGPVTGIDFGNVADDITMQYGL